MKVSFPNFKIYDSPKVVLLQVANFNSKNENFKKGYLIQILREPHPVEQSVIKTNLEN